MSVSYRAQYAGPLLGAGLLLLAGALSVGAQVRLAGAQPTDAQWSQAAEWVVAEAQARDGVRVEPTWSESVLVHLGPVGNLLHRHHRPQIEDFQEVERVWVISEADRVTEAAERLPPGAELESSRSFGEVVVSLYSLPADLDLGPSLLERLPDAQVEHLDADGGQGSECRRWDARRERWNCPGGHYVGRELLEVGDDPRRCAWAHALPDGQVLSVTYPAETLLAEDELGSARWLRLRAGVDLRGARHEHAQPMSFSLFLDDQEVLSQPISKFDSTWWAHTIDLSGLPASGEVRLEIRAEDPEVRGRRFCFNGWVVDDDQARTLRDRSESVESSSSM